MKRFGKILIRISLVLILIFALLITLPKVFEKQIINQATMALNQAIAVPVIVDDINFTLIKRFPHATIQFSNVKILSGEGFRAKDFHSKYKADTLARINNIYVSINLLAFIDQSIEIKKIEINKAQVNILIDKKGNNNYNIFKSTESEFKSDSNRFDIKLNQISLIKTNVTFNNLYKQTNFEIGAPNLKAKASFFNESYFILTEGDLLLKSVQLGSSNYQPKKPSRLDLSLTYTNDTLRVNKSIISTEYANFDISGYTIFKDINYTNISIKGNNISIKQVVHLLPFKDELSDFNSTGFLDFHGLIKGNISNTISPYMLANFGISNGSVQYKDSLSINQVNLKGRFSNGKKRNASTMSLDFKNFDFKTPKSDFKGSFSIQNFIKPKFKIQSDFNVDLAEFSSLANNEFVNGLSGKVKGKIKTEGLTNDTVALDSILFLADHTLSQLYVSDFTLNLPKQGISLNKVSGQLDYMPNKITVDSLKGLFNNINTTIHNGQLENLNHIFKPHASLPLKVTGNFKFDQVVFAEIKPLFENNDSSKSIPVVVQGKVSINNYKHDKIDASQLEANVYINNGRYIIDDLSFHAFDGQITTSINYTEKTDTKAILQTKTSTKDVDISTYFKAFNNFNQKNLTHENIRGRLNSDFESELTFINGKYDLNTLYLLGYAKVSNGQLINFEPIEELARFTNMSELSNISFSTIENEILISDHTIHIPQMDIHSSSFDISLFGKQDLLGDYEYHLRVYLSDILSGKTKQLQKEQSKFGTIEDDGLGKTSIFLVTSHRKGKTKTRFDRRQMREHLKSELAGEKEELKNIFKDEFDWFLNDTIHKQEEKKPAFEIEWDDE